MMLMMLFLTAMGLAAVTAYLTYETMQRKEQEALSFAMQVPKTERMQHVKQYLTHNRMTVAVAVVALLLLLSGQYLLAPLLILLAYLREQAVHIKERRQIIENLPPAIAIMVRSMRAGQTLEQSMNSVLGFTGSPEIKAFFKRVLQKVYISGRPIHEVMFEAAKTSRINEITMLATILESHAQVGGNVTEVLSIFEEQMRRTMVTRKKIVSLMTEGRTSVIILALIPLVVFGAVLNFSPDYLQFFLGREGRFSLILVVFFYLFGIGLSVSFVKGR